MLGLLKRAYFVYTIDYLPLYMFTRNERIVVNSILLLILTLLFTATVRYMPQHVEKISNRVYYYISGDASAQSLL